MCSERSRYPRPFDKSGRHEKSSWIPWPCNLWSNTNGQDLIEYALARESNSERARSRFDRDVALGKDTSRFHGRLYHHTRSHSFTRGSRGCNLIKRKRARAGAAVGVIKTGWAAGARNYRVQRETLLRSHTRESAEKSRDSYSSISQ